MSFIEKIIKFFQDWFNKLSSEGRQRFIIICTAGFAVLLTFSVIMSVRKNTGEEIPGAPERLDFFLAIPAEELFLPDEPDFLLGVLLERERRESWTEQDAVEHWQDPLMFGEEQWRKKIETAMDEFLERVP